MSGILDLLNSEKGKTLIHNASKETGASEEETGQVLKMAMPLLLGALNKNAKSPEGASKLLGALSNKHDGSLLDSLGGMLGGGGVDDGLKKDGGGILGHVLGGKQDMIAQTLAQKVGLNPSTVSQILKIAAPIVLSYLGKKKNENNVNEPGGLSSLLGNLVGNQPKTDQSLMESLLDRDGDGSIMNDLGGLLGGSKGKKGTGGGIGGLFGK